MSKHTQATAIAQIEFAESNIRVLNDRDAETVRSLRSYFSENKSLTPSQVSLADILYENTMAGLGFGSVRPKHDYKIKLH